MVKITGHRTQDAGRKIFSKARRYLVGGVNSPVRSFSAVGGVPLLIKKGKGSKAYDYDGKQYIDYVLSFGAAILGHAHPAIERSVVRATRDGFGFGATHDSEITLAAKIQEAIPFVEKIRFTNSGTEGVMGAIRLARGVTGKTAILKFANSYHGHADYLLAKAGSGLATLNIPASAGVPADFIKHTLIAPYNDMTALKKTFEKYGKHLAAVIVEPAAGNFGVTAPDVLFLKALRHLTKKYGVLLVADEVITGFRFHYGSLMQTFGIEPDLICLGKIIGGGLPIGAYGASKKIMSFLAPCGPVYQASTFAGNPIVMQAGISMLSVLRKESAGYQKINAFVEQLVSGFARAARSHGIDLALSHYGSMFSLRFQKPDDFRIFYKHMRAQGIFLAPSEFEANFVSLAHSQRDIAQTIDAAAVAFKKLS